MVVSGIFPGAVFNLYYFESQGRNIWRVSSEDLGNAYGVVVNVKQDGTIYAVKTLRKERERKLQEMI